MTSKPISSLIFSYHSRKVDETLNTHKQTTYQGSEDADWKIGLENE